MHPISPLPLSKNPQSISTLHLSPSDSIPAILWENKISAWKKISLKCFKWHPEPFERCFCLVFCTQRKWIIIHNPKSPRPLLYVEFWNIKVFLRYVNWNKDKMPDSPAEHKIALLSTTADDDEQRAMCLFLRVDIFLPLFCCVAAVQRGACGCLLI